MIKLPGDGGAPDVTITGPGGVSASNSGQSPAISGPFVIYPIPAENATYIGILKPRAGPYTVSSNAGSAAIAQVLVADGLAPSVAAHVTVHHGRLALVYRASRTVGQRVTFLERAGEVYRTIGSTSTSTGRLAFAPGPGPAGVRQIVAELTENGAPVVLRPGATGPGAYETVLASYRAPGPRPLPRVANVRVRHVGTRVQISWSGVRAATQYAVTVTLSSGEHLTYLTRGRALTVPSVFGEFTGRVTIQALGDAGRTTTGPARVATIPRERQ
jgi:hypothetical protein